MNSPMFVCGCERGDNCTRATMCAVAAAYEAGKEAVTDPVQEFKDEVLECAKVFEEEVIHGRRLIYYNKARDDLLAAIRAWQEEIADGAPDA